MKLSVILPCFNAAATLERQLDALMAQVWDQAWEVVVADDRSSDQTLAIARRYEKWPRLKVICVEGRHGTAHVINAGIRASTGESIALCNADDEVGPGWVAAMGEALERHEFVSGCLEQTKLNPPWLQWPQQDRGLQGLWYPPFVPHAGGCSLGFTRSTYDRVGPFDESLGNLEDTDYCIRVQLSGIPLVFVPGAIVHYRRRSTLRGLFEQACSYAEWNAVIARRNDPADGTAQRFYGIFFIEWARLVRDVRKLGSMGGRVAWCWRLGFQVGRLKGWVRRSGIPV